MRAIDLSHGIRAGPVLSFCAEDEERRPIVLDIIMIALGVGFFAAAILYVHACDRM
jgi:hypothetical protein